MPDLKNRLSSPSLALSSALTHRTERPEVVSTIDPAMLLRDDNIADVQIESAPCLGFTMFWLRHYEVDD